MMGPSNLNKTDLLVRFMLFLVTTLLVVYALSVTASYFYNIVILLGISLIFTYILFLPVGWTERGIVFLSRKAHTNARFHWFAAQTIDVHPRILAVITVYFISLLLFLVAAGSLFPLLSHQVEDFGRALPRYVTQAESGLLDWSNRTMGAETLRKIFDPDIEMAQKKGVVKSPTHSSAPITAEEKQVIQESFLRNTVTQATQLIERVTTTLLENVVGLITHTISGLIYFLTGLVLVFYFLLDGSKLRLGVLRMVPSTMQRPAAYFMDSFHNIMLNFVKGQFILAIISGTLMFILYSLFNVKYAIFLSAFFTVAEILPVIGPWLAFTPGVLVMVFSEHPETALYVWGLYVLIKDNFLLPKVVGEVMGLHPVVVIFSLFIFAKIGGVMGVVLALPLTSILNVTFRYALNPPTDIITSPDP